MAEGISALKNYLGESSFQPAQVIDIVILSSGKNMTTTTIYRNQVLAELETFPEEYLPFVLQLMRTFRESVTLKSATDSFRQGWQEARQGEVAPIATLWDEIDAE